jgi:hypothetical protein
MPHDPGADVDARNPIEVLGWYLACHAFDHLREIIQIHDLIATIR